MAGVLGPALAITTLAVPSAPASPGPLAVGTEAVQEPGSVARRRPTDYSGVIRKLSRDIPALMNQHKVVGLTITLVDGNRVVWKRGFGYADQAARKRVTADTLFTIGSVSKTFAAAAVMQLVERGWVNLDDPLSKYVPGFRLRKLYRDNVISVRSVLDHHSGIPGDVLNGLITSRRPDPGFRAWLLRALRKMYPEHRVNTVWAYNNSGYVLLQNLVEHVSGMGLEQYARKYLFRPMGMRSTYFDPTRVPVRRLSREYLATFSPEGQPIGAQAQSREFVNGWAAGSMTSSATDMSGYLRMLFARGRTPGGRVLRESTLRRMWTPQTHTPLDDRTNYMATGLGWFLRSQAIAWAGDNRSHDGATVYVQSTLRLLPRSKLGVFVSINTASTGGVHIAAANEALSLAYTAKTGKRQPPAARLPRQPTSPWSQAALRRHAGAYAAGKSLGFVTVAGGNLRFDGGGGTPITFSPTRSGWFKPDQPGQPQIKFRKVAGRHLMLGRFPNGPAIMIAVVGQRVAPSRKAGAWRSRLGDYTATNANRWNTHYLVSGRITLRSITGILAMQMDNGTVQALNPASRGVAFTAGLGIEMGRAKGDTVEAGRTPGGRPTLTYLGVRYVRTGSAAATTTPPPPSQPGLLDMPRTWSPNLTSPL